MHNSTVKIQILDLLGIWMVQTYLVIKYSDFRKSKNVRFLNNFQNPDSYSDAIWNLDWYLTSDESSDKLVVGRRRGNTFQHLNFAIRHSF